MSLEAWGDEPPYGDDVEALCPVCEEPLDAYDFDGRYLCICGWSGLEPAWRELNRDPDPDYDPDLGEFL